MIKPNINQNVLNFTITRFINEISPIYQIDTLLNNILSISNKLNNSELIIKTVDLSKLSNFGRHMVDGFSYVAYDSSNISYSQPSIMGYLTETHSNNIDTDELSAISRNINSYISLGYIPPVDANRILSLIAPHKYILLDYNNLSLNDISKITTTIKLEDTTPSSVSMSNQIFTYEISLYLVNSVFNSKSFPGSVNYSFSGYLYNSISMQFASNYQSIPSDVSNFLSDDGLFYDNIIIKLNSLFGISHATSQYSDMIKNTVNRTFRDFFINSPTDSFISYMNNTIDQFGISVIGTYTKLIMNDLSKSILDSIISKNMLTAVNNQEKSIIKSIYTEYSNLYDDVILDIEALCSRLSKTSLELLNTHIHLYGGLFSSLDSFIVNQCSSFFQIQQSIDSTVSDTILLNEIERVILSNDYSTSNTNNIKMMNAAISTELTLSFEKYIDIQRLNASYSRNLLQPIIDAISSGINYNSSKTGEMKATLTNIIISEFNSACWLRPEVVLSSSYPKFKSSFDFTSALNIQYGLTSLLDRVYKNQQSRIKGEGILPKLIATSIFNVAMNGNLDDHINQKPV